MAVACPRQQEDVLLPPYITSYRNVYVTRTEMWNTSLPDAARLLARPAGPCAWRYRHSDEDLYGFISRSRTLIRVGDRVWHDGEWGSVDRVLASSAYADYQTRAWEATATIMVIGSVAIVVLFAYILHPARQSPSSPNFPLTRWNIADMSPIPAHYDENQPILVSKPHRSHETATRDRGFTLGAWRYWMSTDAAGHLEILSPTAMGTPLMTTWRSGVGEDHLICTRDMPCFIHGRIAEVRLIKDLPIGVVRQMFQLHLFKCNSKKCVCFASGHVDSLRNATVYIDETNGKLLTGWGTAMEALYCGGFAI
jgi:hypothetical protein